MTDQTIATRDFSRAEHALFARASSDVNPMHMDEVAARRTQAAAPVVHGVHVTTWVLNELALAGLPVASLVSFRVEFAKFVYLGRTVSLRIVQRTETMVRVEVRGDDLTLLTLNARFGVRKPAGDPPVSQALAVVAVGAEPSEPAFDAMATLRGWLAPPVEVAELDAAYPELSQAIGPERVAALAQTSTLVGMVCPGLHSIYSALSLRLVDDLSQRPGIGFCTTDADKRFNLLTMAVAGSGLVGEVTAFARQAPVAPPQISQLRTLVAADEFSGVSALVVGGSRGLGAVTASLIAAGGGRVMVTYARGRAEAEALCDQINAACGPRIARMLQLDVRADLAAQLAGMGGPINQLYYFATPQIGRQQAALFSDALFREFSSIYVERFFETCQHLIKGADGAPLAILYPSSVFVTDRPRGMTEYAMAKAAGEVLCAELDETTPSVRVRWPRLPMMATDQTASVVALDTQSPVDVMLPVIRGLTSDG